MYVGVGKVKIKRGNKNHHKTENSSLLGATKGKSIGLEKGTDIQTFSCLIEISTSSHKLHTPFAF